MGHHHIMPSVRWTCYFGQTTGMWLLSSHMKHHRAVPRCQFFEAGFGDGPIGGGGLDGTTRLYKVFSGVFQNRLFGKSDLHLTSNVMWIVIIPLPTDSHCLLDAIL